jgi:pentatricopeptide repeat protein
MNKYTDGALINLFCKQREMEEAHKVLNLIVERGYKLGLVSYIFFLLLRDCLELLQI